MDSTETQKPLLQEKPVKTSSAAWLGAANAFNGLLVAFAEGTAVTYFFVNKLGLDTKYNSIVWIIFGIWNALNDPLYGFLADHTHSKLGRRRPWIRYGAPLISLFYCLMWIQWPGMNSSHQGYLMAMELISLFLYDIVYTAVASAIYVMPYEMAVTNKARNKVFLWSIGFSLIQYLIPMIANTFLDQLMKDSVKFSIIMAVIGIICGAIIFASTFFYKENGYVEEEKQPGFFEGLKMCVKNRPFMLFEVLSWTVIYAQGALTTGLTYMQGMWANDFTLTGYNSAADIAAAKQASDYAASYGWIGSASLYVLAGALVLGLIVGLVLFISTVQKWGTRTDTLITCGVMGFGTIIGSFLGMYFWVLVVSIFTIGIGMAGGIYLIPIVNGDVIDYDELQSGKRREGTYAGINSLFTKLASAIAQAVFPAMMRGFGFKNLQVKELNADGTEAVDLAGKSIKINNWGAESNSAKNWLFFCWLSIIAILLILSFIAMWFYPLHGKDWDEKKAHLAQVHKEKEEAYEQKVLAEHPEDIAKR